MKPRAAQLVGALSGAVIAVSTAAVVILLADPLSPLTIAAGRVAVTGIGLAVVASLRGGSRSRSSATHHGSARDSPPSRSSRGIDGRTIIAATLLAVHFAAWIASLSMTSVVRSVTLVATQPLFAGLFARALGDRVSPRLYLGGAVAVLGTAVMLGAFAEDAAVDGPTLGDALAVIAGAAAAGYLAIGRSLRDRVALPGYLARVHLLAAILLVVAIAIAREPLASGPVDARHVAAILWLGLVPGLVGHGLLNWAVRYLPVHTVALAVLLEPLGASTLAAIVLARPITVLEIIGATVILCGVGLAILTRSPR